MYTPPRTRIPTAFHTYAMSLADTRRVKNPLSLFSHSPVHGSFHSPPTFFQLSFFSLCVQSDADREIEEEAKKRKKNPKNSNQRYTGLKRRNLTGVGQQKTTRVKTKTSSFYTTDRKRVEPTKTDKKTRKKEKKKKTKRKDKE